MKKEKNEEIEKLAGRAEAAPEEAGGSEALSADSGDGIQPSAGEITPPQNEDVAESGGAPAETEEALEELNAEALRAELEEKKREVEEYKDKWLRAVAELDNFRKRYMKEKAELIKYGNESVLKEFLGILDNLERALSSAKRSKEMEPLIEGLELIIKQFEAILERFGVKSIEAKGRPFDPYVHEAIMHVESDEHPENTVLEEFQRGFTFHDRLLRPAKVSVSKKAESAEKNGD